MLNWFGDWSTEALYQVGKEFTSKMDLEKPNYIVPDYMPVVYDKLPQPPTHREAIVNSCVFVHQTLHQVCAVWRATQSAKLNGFKVDLWGLHICISGLYYHTFPHIFIT